MTYTQPLILVFLLVILAGLIGKRRGGVWIAGLGLTGLFLLSLPAADWLFSRHLEAWYPERPFSGGSAEAIVVLSGSVDPPRRGRPYALPDPEMFERCQFAAWLYKHWRQAPVLASGGIGPKGTVFSDTMRDLLEQAGVPESAIWTEGRSRNTHENAVYSAEVLREHGISTVVLVVDAQSMLRAELCFRKQGLTVAPAPSDWTTLGPLSRALMPSWRAIYRNEITLHETLGLGWYWLRGWI